MKRSRLEQALEEYAAGDLDGAERLEIERRLQDEPHARELHERIVAARDALQSLRDRPEPPVGADDILPRIQAAIARQGFESRPRLYLESGAARFYRRMALAASLLLVVSFGVFGIARVYAPGAPVDNVTTEPPVERDLEPVSIDRLVEAGSRGISADEYFRIIEKLDRDPREVTVRPVANVVPGFAEER